MNEKHIFVGRYIYNSIQKNCRIFALIVRIKKKKIKKKGVEWNINCD